MLHKTFAQNQINRQAGKNALGGAYNSRNNRVCLVIAVNKATALVYNIDYINVLYNLKSKYHFFLFLFIYAFLDPSQ